ncbi:MAG: anthranilate synthase component I family protein [Planctomycetota bacterium]
MISVKARSHCVPLSALTGLLPHELFLRLADEPRLFWLDSGAPNLSEQWSYFGWNPTRRIELFPDRICRWDSRTSSPTNDYSERRPSADKLWRDFVRLLKPNAAPPPPDSASPPFRGGWVGYLGYDYNRWFEGRKRDEQDKFPLMSFSFYDLVLAFSHRDASWWASILLPDTASPAELSARIEQLMAEIETFCRRPQHVFPRPPRRQATASMSRERYESNVTRALEYIAAGDIYQINLALRFSVPWDLSPAALYWWLRAISPAAFGAFLGADLAGSGSALCSISPELFLRVRGNEVSTRPIKGTRPRGLTQRDILAARRELETNAKERAELNMIVDLERNDLGRVCAYDSVRVSSAGQIEELPTLLHRVATVTGQLNPRHSRARLISAMFPGGSITGAPKIRAMQIIDELESTPRGPYCGVIGWLGVDGNLDLSIAIRTALYDGAQRVAYYHAGSGIVADSDPAAEYDETLQKAAAFLRATNATLNPRRRRKIS